MQIHHLPCLVQMQKIKLLALFQDPTLGQMDGSTSAGMLSSLACPVLAA